MYSFSKKGKMTLFCQKNGEIGNLLHLAQFTPNIITGTLITCDRHNTVKKFSAVLVERKDTIQIPENMWTGTYRMTSMELALMGWGQVPILDSQWMSGEKWPED
jgi:hypothetical protein